MRSNCRRGSSSVGLLMYSLRCGGVRARCEVPIYDYRCAKCGRVWEVFQRGQNADPLRCPDCGASGAEKLPSAAVLARSSTAATKGGTCCGREERCDRPPCASGGECHRG